MRNGLKTKGGRRYLPNAECGLRNAEFLQCRMRNDECGMRNGECGMASAECGAAGGRTRYRLKHPRETRRLVAALRGEPTEPFAPGDWKSRQPCEPAGAGWVVGAGRLRRDRCSFNFRKGRCPFGKVVLQVR